MNQNEVGRQKNDDNKSGKKIPPDFPKEFKTLRDYNAYLKTEQEYKKIALEQEKRIVHLEENEQKLENTIQQYEHQMSEITKKIDQLEAFQGQKNELQNSMSQIKSQIQIDKQQTQQNEILLKENIKKDLFKQLTEEINNFKRDQQNRMNENLQNIQGQIMKFENKQNKYQEDFINQQSQIQNLIISQQKNDQISQDIKIKLQDIDLQLKQQVENQKQDQFQQLLDYQNNLKQNIDQNIKQIQQAFQQDISNLNQDLQKQFDETHKRIQQEVNQYKLELIEMIQNIKPQDQEFIQQYHLSNEQIYQQIHHQKEELIEIIQNRNHQEQDMMTQFHQCNEQMQQQISQQKEELIGMIQSVNPNQEISIQLNQIKEQFQQQIETLSSQIREIKHNMNPLQQSSSQINPPPSPPPEIIQLPQNTIISTLYDKSIRARYVEPQFRKFVNDIQNQKDMFKEYGIRSSEEKTKLANYLSGMRKVRGDGNCFYTSFVFQYLQHQLINTSDQEFQNLIEEIQSLPFKVQFKDIEFQQKDFDILKCKFTDELKKLRQLQEDRIDKFTQLMQDDECEFYGLAIVFIRNLAYKACDNEEIKGIFNSLGYDMKQQLLEWEFDCQNNECVVNRLSEYLKIHILMYFITPENKVMIHEYKPLENALQQIHMIFRPGHYCIGVPLC